MKGKPATCPERSAPSTANAVIESSFLGADTRPVLGKALIVYLLHFRRPYRGARPEEGNIAFCGLGRPGWNTSLMTRHPSLGWLLGNEMVEFIEHAFFHCMVMRSLCAFVEDYIVRMLLGQFFVLEAISIWSNEWLSNSKYLTALFCLIISC